MENRLKQLANSYIAQVVDTLQKGDVTLSQRDREELELAFEAGFRQGIVESSRRESPQPEPPQAA